MCLNCDASSKKKKKAWGIQWRAVNIQMESQEYFALNIWVFLSLQKSIVGCMLTHQERHVLGFRQLFATEANPKVTESCKLFVQWSSGKRKCQHKRGGRKMASSWPLCRVVIIKAYAYNYVNLIQFNIFSDIKFMFIRGKLCKEIQRLCFSYSF